MAMFGGSRLQELEEEVQALKEQLEASEQQKAYALRDAEEYKKRCQNFTQSAVDRFEREEFQTKIQALETELIEKEDQINMQQQELLKVRQKLQEMTDQRDAALAGKGNAGTDTGARPSSESEYLGMKELYRKKLQELEDQKDELELQMIRNSAAAMAEQRSNLEAELQEARNSFKAEIEAERAQIEEDIVQAKKARYEKLANNVQLFQERYQHYLNQISQLVTGLNTAAAKTCSEMFEDKEDSLDIATCFDSAFSAKTKKPENKKYIL